MEGLENILKAGETQKLIKFLPDNPMAVLIENAGGMDIIDTLQQHENNEVYQLSVKILERYFGAVDDNSDNDNILGIGPPMPVPPMPAGAAPMAVPPPPNFGAFGINDVVGFGGGLAGAGAAGAAGAGAAGAGADV